MGTIVLKEGKEKPVLNHHPWIFSGAIAHMEGNPSDGDVVEVVDSQRRFLARGYLNQRSQITVRLLSWREDEAIDQIFWQRRIEQAIKRRQALLDGSITNACRLIHAESDLLPGLIVDRYADYLVVQSLTLGIEQRKAEIVSILAELLRPEGIYERSDVDVREKEHLSPSTGLLWGKEPPSLLEIQEHGHWFLVDIQHGQKTGFYLDQRDNRLRLMDYSCGRIVLNAFAYTGSFGVYAAKAGAERIVSVDTSADALGLALDNMSRNGLTHRDDEYIVGDVFVVLRQFRAEGRQFDLIILDPPKFAHSQAQVQAACRGYKDINLLAMQLLRSDGILFTMSCSGLVTPELFQKVVFGASVDAQCDVQVLEKLSQATDHPILLSFPEGEYLKGFVCRML
ncbi:MAG: class I SAM-dependent rRNA methyltransferase [Anaerolineae bacterium]